MNDRTESRQVKRLFTRGIAAADHDERLVAENRQRAVASRAVSHSFGFQQIFAWHAKMPMARARGDDDRFRFNFSTIHSQDKWTFGKIHLLDHAKTGARPETFRLFLHPRHQFVAIHALGKAGVILHDARRGEQAAGLPAGKDERLKIGARGVKRRRPARAA